MGLAQSWIAVKSEKIAAVLSFLELSPNGERCECACLDVMYADMHNGWHVVVSNDRAGCFFTERPNVLAEISSITDLLAGAIEEHVNYSVCESWLSGKRVWKVERLLS